MKSLKESFIKAKDLDNIKNRDKFISKYITDELYNELRSNMYEEGFELFIDEKGTKITAYPQEVYPTRNNRIFMIDLEHGGKVKWFKSEPYEFNVTYHIQRLLGLE